VGEVALGVMRGEAPEDAQSDLGVFEDDLERIEP
jgi:hypothetical protein